MPHLSRSRSRGRRSRSLFRSRRSLRSITRTPKRRYSRRSRSLSKIDLLTLTPVRRIMISRRRRPRTPLRRVRSTSRSRRLRSRSRLRRSRPSRRRSHPRRRQSLSARRFASFLSWLYQRRRLKYFPNFGPIFMYHQNIRRLEKWMKKPKSSKNKRILNNDRIFKFFEIQKQQPTKTAPIPSLPLRIKEHQQARSIQWYDSFNFMNMKLSWGLRCLVSEKFILKTIQ